ncbi:hypothetical protein HPG69_010190 [Diceros bicornis minor]|uniref:Uncharacterized protein n=1 Tax=Diceros bicornis minor TaxID=77932 RepID=A0A7J7EEC1_DICBM|nr:hypothetical protein HPG69_010190 [Diceros bicornis minor]
MGHKFKSKSGTIGNLPPKHPGLPLTQIRVKDECDVEEQEAEEEEEKEEEKDEKKKMVVETVGYSRKKQKTRKTCLSHMEQNNYNQKICQTTPTLKKPSASKNECEKNREELKILQSKQTSTNTFLPPNIQNYCGWVPPEGQRRGGSSHLHDNMAFDSFRIRKEDFVDQVAWDI